MKRIVFVTAFALLAQSQSLFPVKTVTPGTVHVSYSSSELLDIIANTPNVVVDFSASWCGPCKRMEPILNSLAAEFPTIAIIKVDVDLFDNVGAVHNVMSYPTFVFFKNGKKVSSQVGSKSPKEFKSLLTRYF